MMHLSKSKLKPLYRAVSGLRLCERASPDSNRTGAGPMVLQARGIGTAFGAQQAGSSWHGVQRSIRDR